jgi:hypothetical protein
LTKGCCCIGGGGEGEVSEVWGLEESTRLVLRRNDKDNDEEDNAIHRLALVRSTKEGDDASSGSGMMNCVERLPENVRVFSGVVSFVLAGIKYRVNKFA